MKTALFDFNLPPDRIATHPLEPRDAARMLVVNKNIRSDEYIYELPSFIEEGDVMVFNDTRVIPARLTGKRGEVTIEMTLHKEVGTNRWLAFARPGKRLKPGNEIIFSSELKCIILSKHETGEIEVMLECKNLFKALEKYGEMPLPCYMKRRGQSIDKEKYQTIYAANEGAVAAPTAGLHFTQRLFDALDAKGVKRVFVTLHVGAGTFQPVKAEDTDDHIMHSEYAEISVEVSGIINRAHEEGRRIIAVGTTSLRTLESAVDAVSGKVMPFRGDTKIFITPGYRFKAVDILLTNFHLPRSTLFMLVSAFAGRKNMQEAYRHAIESQYRFYSYGDACLLFREALL